MGDQLKGRKVAFLAADGVEQDELTQPWNVVKEAGGVVTLVSAAIGEIQGVTRGEKAERFKVNSAVSQVTARDFDALVLPGGARSADRLRTNPAAVRFVRGFMEADKPVAAICHGPGMLVEAGMVKGRTLTSWPSLKADIEKAGGSWVDKQVEVDQKLITSRKPEDLPAFCSKLVQILSVAIEERRLDRMIEQSFPASDPLPGPTA